MTDKELALIEDSDWLFVTNQSVFEQPARLGVSAETMQNLWARVGNYMRAAAFNLVIQEENVRTA